MTPDFLGLPNSTPPSTDLVVVPDCVPVEFGEPVGGMPLTAAERRAVAMLRRLSTGDYPLPLVVDRLAHGLLARLVEAGGLDRLGFFGDWIVINQDLRSVPSFEAAEVDS